MQLRGNMIMESIVCKKAQALYEDLWKQNPGTLEETSADTFKASHNWFDNFKKQTGIHSTVKYGEAVSSDMKPAEDFVSKFSHLIVAKEYITEQVFNYDEIGLFSGLFKEMKNSSQIK